MSERITDARLKELASAGANLGYHASVAEWQAMAQELLEAREALSVIVNVCNATPHGGMFVDKTNDFIHIAEIADRILKGTP